jgi:hypothetical protein
MGISALRIPPEERKAKELHISLLIGNLNLMERLFIYVGTMIITTL